MSVKLGSVAVQPKAQPNQYSCCTTSLSISLISLGFSEKECNVERVNDVLGAMPLHGASWDQVAGAASHFGCRAVLVVPCTLKMVRKWTDAGIPVIASWTKPGVSWSHASVIFDVTDTQVFLADPNVENPDKLTRVFTHDEFYEKWYEMSPQGYKIRRPAMAIMPEITPDGRQMIASQTKRASWGLLRPEQVSMDIIRAIGERASEYRPKLRIIKSGLKSEKLTPYMVGLSYDLHSDVSEVMKDPAEWKAEYNKRWGKVLEAAKAAGYTLVGNPLSKDRVIGSPEADKIALVTGVVGVLRSVGGSEAQKVASLPGYISGTVEKIRTLGYGGTLGPNPDGIFGISVNGKEYLVDGPLEQGLGRGSTVTFAPGRVLDPIYHLPSAQGLFVKTAKAPQPVQQKVASGYSKQAELLKTMFVVRDPDKDSTLIDIVFATNAHDLPNYVIGTGAARWRNERTAIHTDAQSALVDATARFKKLWGGNIPDSVWQYGRTIHTAKAPQPVQQKKPLSNKITIPPSTIRNDAAKALKDRGGAGAGIHQNREKDFEKGQTRKPKHKKDWQDKEASVDRLVKRYEEKTNV